ncbi:MAG: DUF1800 domain-containing protein [bacterium]|nr:DUF1800 domain-containing protein [bacterium]
MALTPYSGTWGTAQAAHLVRRTMIGATPADVQNALGKGLNGAVDALLTDSPEPREPIAYLKTGSVAEGGNWASSSYEDGSDNTRNAFLRTWWIDIMMNQDFSAREKMTLFWANHYSTGSTQVHDARYMFNQNALLRANAFGSAKDLTKAVTFDPAMLRYLSGASNTKANPNENYARELQELFTIGKGPEVAPGDYVFYTEADVKMAAKVLTGWKDDQAGMKPVFTSANHDNGTKTFSHRYSQRAITGGNSQVGATRELDDLLTMIYDQPEAARFLARKLYRFFVDYVVTPEIEADIIESLAQVLRDNNYEVRPALKALFTSSWFYDAERMACVIKTPVELVLGTFRLFHPADLYPTDSKLLHWAYRAVHRTMATMAQDLFNPPNVAGLPAYYQAPAYHELWINADTLQKRVRFTNEIALDGYQLDESYEKSYLDPFLIRPWLSDPTDAVKLVNDVAAVVFAVPINEAQRQALVDILLTGQPMSTWASAWLAYEGNPSDATKAVVELRLRTLLKFMLGMAEYQVC